MEEPEAAAELGAMGLDRPPHALVPGVVIDDEHFVVGIIEPLERIECLDQHLGRLVVGRHVHGNHRLRIAARERRRAQAAPVRDPVGLGPLVRFGEQHENDAQHPEQQQHTGDDAGHGHVLLREIVEHPHRDRGGRVHHDREEAAPAVAQRFAVEVEDSEHEQRDDHGNGGQDVPLRHAHDRRRELKLGIAVDVVHAPVRAHRPFLVRLPGLIESFHHVIDDLLLLGALQEAAQEQRLVGIRGNRGFARAAVAGPADFGYHDRLARKHALQPAKLPERVLDRRIDGHSLPVRQQVHADEVDVLGQLRMREPHVPRLGGADWLPDGVPGAIEIVLELLHGQIAAQDHFVANDDAHHVDVSARQLHGRLELSLVLVAVTVDPRAHRDVDPVPFGQLRCFGQRAGDAISADRIDLAFKQLEIRVDLGHGRQLLARRVLTDPQRREREPLDADGPWRLRCRAVEESPDGERQGGEGRRDQQAG